MHKILVKLRSALPRSTFTANVLNLASSTALGQGLTVLSLPLLTRLYSPSDLNSFALFAALLSIFSVISSLLYETAIVSAETNQEAASLTFLSVFISVGLTPIIIVFSYIGINQNILGFGVLDAYCLFLIPIAFLLTAVLKTLRYLLMRQGSFSIISKITVSQSISRSITQIISGLCGLVPLGLFLGDVVGRAVGIKTSFEYSSKPLFENKENWSVRELQTAALKNLAFPLLACPSSLINALSIYLVVPIVTQIADPGFSGNFVLAQRVLSIPLVLIGGSVADVFHQHISHCLRAEPQKVRKVFLETAKKLCFLGLVPMILIAALSPILFETIFGLQWSQAGILCSILVPWSLAGLVVSPLSRVVFVFQGQTWKLIYDLTSLIILYGTLYGSHCFNILPTYAVAILSFASALSYILYFFVLLKIIKKWSTKHKICLV